MSALTKLVKVPTNVNAGLKGTRNALMLALLGNPRGDYARDCRSVTNAKLKARIKTKNFGPFKATGFDLAVASLTDVMGDIANEQPAVHSALTTAGMLCVRFVRGSASAISNHSWGTAIDLKIDGKLDARGDNKVQFGLTLIAPIFNRHGWYWGAHFPTEDGMHFEVSEQKLRKWQKDGLLLGGAAPAVSTKLILGDRSAQVKELQQRLNKLGERIETDGVFGPATHAAVVAFQGSNGLTPSGVVDKTTWAKLLALTS